MIKTVPLPVAHIMLGSINVFPSKVLNIGGNSPLSAVISI
jgi:hypothetical protein